MTFKLTNPAVPEGRALHGNFLSVEYSISEGAIEDVEGGFVELTKLTH